MRYPLARIGVLHNTHNAGDDDDEEDDDVDDDDDDDDDVPFASELL
jgi:hypothetical protein